MSARSVEAVFIKRPALCRRWAISRATSYRLEEDGYLPKPVRLGRGAPRWPISEIERIEASASADRGQGRAS